jgi:apolipoprotein N-acyltransferase
MARSPSAHAQRAPSGLVDAPASAPPAPRGTASAAWPRWARRPLVAAPLLCLGAALIAVPFLDTHLWLLAWFGLVPLFALAPHTRSVRTAALYGLLMGFVVNVIGFHWVVTTITRFGGFPLAIALFFFSALSLYAALPFAIVAAALRWSGSAAPLLLAPALWAGIEFAFPAMFPWRLAHSQREVTLLLQTGDLAGPYLLSFVMAYFAAALTRLPRVRPLLGACGAVAALLIYGGWRFAQVEREIAAAPAFTVGVVQGNLLLDEKRQHELFDSNVARYRRLSATLSPPPDLLVWPETVVEWGIPHDTETLDGLDPYPNAPAPLLFGAVAYRDWGRRTEWFNSAFLRRANGSIGGRYDKIVLMPFGEYIPFSWLFPSLKELSPNTGDFQAGAGPVVLRVSDRARVGALICYEDLLSGHVRQTVAAGANLLVTMTNDAWFGHSAALHEHDSLALWRTVENRRYLVRATNSGLSTVTDPLGRTVAALPTQTATAASVPVHLLSGTTPYQRFGDAFGYLTLALAISLLIYSHRFDRA